MKTAWGILTLSCILAFSTSTGKYLPQQAQTRDTTGLDTSALLSIIQPVADSFALAAVKKIDSVASLPKFFVKRVDIERRIDSNDRAWIIIYRHQNGTSQYDTTIIAEIPN